MQLNLDNSNSFSSNPHKSDYFSFRFTYLAIEISLDNSKSSLIRANFPFLEGLSYRSFVFS